MTFRRRCVVPPVLEVEEELLHFQNLVGVYQLTLVNDLLRQGLHVGLIIQGLHSNADNVNVMLVTGL